MTQRGRGISRDVSCEEAFGRNCSELFWKTKNHESLRQSGTAEALLSLTDPLSDGLRSSAKDERVSKG